MSETKNLLDVSDIARQLNDGQLSRGGLFDLLKGLGIGFGAAFVLGMSGAQAATTPEATVTLKSTNPVLDSIIQEGQPAATESVSSQHMAYYYRYYHRYYHPYSRYYSRY